MLYVTNGRIVLSVCLLTSIIRLCDYQFPTAVAPHEPAGERNWALVVGQEDAGVSSEALLLLLLLLLPLLLLLHILL